MPADDSLPQTSRLHSNAAEPYPCHVARLPPAAPWSFQFGYCRTSMDSLAGHTDPRCPSTCLHKAPTDVMRAYEVVFFAKGAAEAAAWSREERAHNDGMATGTN